MRFYLTKIMIVVTRSISHADKEAHPGFLISKFVTMVSYGRVVT